jgi:hypothetical protein
MRAVLLLLVLGLSGLLYVQWELAPEQAPSLAPQRGAAPSEGVEPKVAAEDFALGDPQAFDEISQRPLFTEGRRPPEDVPQEVVAPEQKEGLKGLNLSTVLITPRESVAWVKDAKSSELIRLEPGKKIRGWTVQAVQPDRLLLASGTETSELELREFPAEAAPRPPVRPVRPGARAPSKRRSPPNRRKRK